MTLYRPVSESLGKYLELLIQQLFLSDVTKHHNDRLAEFRVMIQDKTEADIVDQALDVGVGFRIFVLRVFDTLGQFGDSQLIDRCSDRITT